MNRELRNIESIRPRNELFWFLTMPDLLFLIFVVGSVWVIRDLAYQPLKEFLWIGTGINCLFLLKPSKNNPGKSHMIMMYLSVRRFVTGSGRTIKSIDGREFEEE